MKIVAIIPCRYGSTRFDGQGKPIAPILGKPMIQWVYEKAKESDILDDVVVATDDERIRDAVRRFGGRVEMTARVHRSGTDRAAEAAGILALDAEDIVINIQGDQPAFDTRCLSQLVDPLQKDPMVDMTTLVYKITEPAELEDPNHVKCVFDHNGFALYFSRSLIPFGPVGKITYDVFKHLGLYAYRKRFLDVFASLPQGRLEALERLEMLRALEFGHPIRIVETPYDSLEVDTRKDIAKLEAVLKKAGAAYQ
jgi:3-deoxy-manno-octulosonate cytidylyltransferase (CMP-KDO synthetase)